MVDERTLRSHILALRGVLTAAQERCETILREVRAGRIDSAAGDAELMSVCGAVDRLIKQIDALERRLAKGEE